MYFPLGKYMLQQCTHTKKKKKKKEKTQQNYHWGKKSLYLGVMLHTVWIKAKGNDISDIEKTELDENQNPSPSKLHHQW